MAADGPKMRDDAEHRHEDLNLPMQANRNRLRQVAPEFSSHEKFDKQLELDLFRLPDHRAQVVDVQERRPLPSMPEKLRPFRDRNCASARSRLKSLAQNQAHFSGKPR